MTDEHLDAQRLRRLLDVGRSVVSELDLEVVLDRVLEVARELTGARYAALGILDERRQELERFLTRGIDASTHKRIGDLPRGHGILGVLISDPRPLRMPDVGTIRVPTAFRSAILRCTASWAYRFSSAARPTATST